MAKATKNTERVMKMTYEDVVTGVQLELPADEAEAVLTILGMVGGDSEIRDLADNVFNALKGAGIVWKHGDAVGLTGAISCHGVE